MSSGRPFQIWGPWQPWLWKDQRGFSEDRRRRLGSYGVSIAIMWRGARPIRALKVISRILTSILKQTGSQWREARMGVMWCCLSNPVRSLAAAFWSSWWAALVQTWEDLRMNDFYQIGMWQSGFKCLKWFLDAWNKTGQLFWHVFGKKRSESNKTVRGQGPLLLLNNKGLMKL